MILDKMKIMCYNEIGEPRGLTHEHIGSTGK